MTTTTTPAPCGQLEVLAAGFLAAAAQRLADLAHQVTRLYIPNEITNWEQLAEHTDTNMLVLQVLEAMGMHLPREHGYTPVMQRWFTVATTVTDMAEPLAWPTERYCEHGILTVGQLRDMLAGLTDDTQITVGDDGWYLNVEAVRRPVDGETFTVVLETADTFDPRQA